MIWMSTNIIKGDLESRDESATEQDEQEKKTGF